MPNQNFGRSRKGNLQHWRVEWVSAAPNLRYWFSLKFSIIFFTFFYHYINGITCTKKMICQILKSFLLIFKSTLTPHNKKIKNEFEIATKYMSIQ